MQAALPHAKLRRVMYDRDDHIYTRWAIDAHDHQATVPLFNPMLSLSVKKQGWLGLTILRLATASDDESETSAQPSWERMLLTQPPIKRITIASPKDSEHLRGCEGYAYLVHNTWMWQIFEHTHITNEGGITVGNLYKHLKAVLPCDVARVYFEMLAPRSGTYWHVVDAKRLRATTLRNHIRRYEWEDPRQSPIGWEPFEDGIDLQAIPIVGVDKVREHLDGSEQARRLAGGRAALRATEG